MIFYSTQYYGNKKTKEKWTKKTNTYISTELENTVSLTLLADRFLLIGLPRSVACSQQHTSSSLKPEISYICWTTPLQVLLQFLWNLLITGLFQEELAIELEFNIFKCNGLQTWRELIKSVFCTFNKLYEFLFRFSNWAHIQQNIHYKSLLGTWEMSCQTTMYCFFFYSIEV